MGRHPLFFPYLALISVCFFWGTTYLGIRMALEGFPPLVLISGRFLIAGSIMLLIAWWKKSQFPKGRQLLLTSLYGVLILGVANGCLTFAEQWVPSSLAALMLTISPLVFVSIEHFSGGERIRRRTLLGLLVGLCGAVLLVLPREGSGGMNQSIWKGFAVLCFGTLCWNSGSILQRRQRLTTHPLISGAIQNFASGVVFLPLAIFVPQHPIIWKLDSTLAAIYLIFFGSIVGFSSYIYALERLPISVLSMYNYVNPAVAAVLGVWFYNEPIGWREIAAMLVIFSGVAIVRSAHAVTKNS